jgi:threonine dehydratase
MTCELLPIPEHPDYQVTEELVAEAARALEPYHLETAILPSPHLSSLVGRPVFLKCENQQRTGSFKLRGALFRLLALGKEDRLRGVVTSSAGNHGLGVAWACRHLGIPGLVVVPQRTPRVKRAALEAMMIKVRVQGDGYDQAEAYARELAADAGATFISPFDDPRVIAGNGGSVGLEIRAGLPEVSAVISPVGGGGLAVGLAVALPGIPVLGASSEASPAMRRSLAEGRVYTSFPATSPTIAEGLEGGVSRSTAALALRHLAGVEAVSETSLRAAIRALVAEHRIVAEGSGVAGVAALLEGRRLPGSGAICVVVTGRNIDQERLREILQGG